MPTKVGIYFDLRLMMPVLIFVDGSYDSCFKQFSTSEDAFDATSVSRDDPYCFNHETVLLPRAQ